MYLFLDIYYISHFSSSVDISQLSKLAFKKIAISSSLMAEEKTTEKSVRIN